ncbi:Dyp-type peroxidase [Azospirillum canadense]|uniref:Dyp-type peroxidase n=1 Tax=Azospirillum canadense TaxID=403962 RepID=UPI002225D7C7|nr:Dyp-type peroxidase [Azospirillum canadense]
MTGATAMEHAPELDDIQGMALRAYRFPMALHHFLRIADQASAREWLGQIADRVTTVPIVDGAPDRALNVSLSWRGLKALGLAPDVLESFPEAFRQGMVERARAGKLGDSGDSSPDCWNSPLRDGDLHILVTVSAASAEILVEADDAFRATLEGTARPTIVHTEATSLLPGPDGTPVPVEHFGYRDGIGQPAIEGSGLASIPGQGTAGVGGDWRPLKLGEFVMGYPDEFGNVATSPQPEILARNGTYLVFRKLHQHVARFRAFLKEAAADDGGRERLAAKLMGRWRSGAPLALAPERDDSALAEDRNRNNDFNYDDDLKGWACPVGAHIRRMNPRAGLAGPSADTINRHRVLRQGLPYGARLPPDAADDGQDRGAIIILINADIANQFEFVQRVWMNDGNFAGLGSAKDPLIGNNDGTGTFKVPRKGGFRIVKGLPAFVSTRGGEYFFMPGKRALGYLSEAL